MTGTELDTTSKHESAITKNDIAAVIVTYQPDVQEVIRNVQAVLDQVACVIVVDNSDTVTLAQDTFESARVLLVPNGGNQGIAHALNVGLNIANSRRLGWLLTMDQDSLLPEHYVQDLLSRINSDPLAAKIASVAGTFHDFDGTLNTVPTLGNQEVPYLITSANLVRTSAVIGVSGFRDDFFIDYVDYEISFKLREAGWRVLQYTDVSFDHRIGESHKGNFLGLSFRVSNHSPLRRYYITRNRIVFARENFQAHPKFAVLDMFRLLKDQIKICLGEQRKIAKLRAFCCGAVDAFAGRLGKTTRKF